MTDLPEWLRLALEAKPLWGKSHEMTEACRDGRLNPERVRHMLARSQNHTSDASFSHECEDFIAILTLYAIAFDAADDPVTCAKLVADHMASDNFERWYE